jgi:uncharacterized protein YegP (UPF0339 family)
MATATKKGRGSGKVPLALASEPAPMELLVFQDNGGSYHWTIVAASGELLAQSPGFTSYEDARAAAGRVREGAASACLEPQDADALPVDLGTRRGAPAGGDSDVERWLDEGGAYSAAVAVELPFPR